MPVCARIEYVSRLIDTLLLKAARARGHDAAFEALREAVHYAAPEGFIMPFVIEGELPTVLLRRAMSDLGQEWGERARELLRRAISLRTLRSVPTVDKAGHDTDGGVPSEALSARESEVLLHMARGESNTQIAEALFVSLPTVKTHVASILSKLGAARRSEAVEIARRRAILTFPDA